MSETATFDIAPLYPYIIVKPATRMSNIGIQVAGEEDSFSCEVEVVAFAEEFKEGAGAQTRFCTHVGERIFVKRYSSPKLNSANHYFVHEDDVLGYKPE